MAPVSAWAYCHGIALRRYLDDWLVSAPSRALCIDDAKALLLLCSRLGIQVNSAKSDLRPGQWKQFFGMVLDS